MTSIRQPDVLLFTCYDHVNSFSFDRYSALALGVGEHWGMADEGGGARDLLSIDGALAVAAHVVLEKPAAVVEVPNRHVYTPMRGETPEKFQRTRNAPGTLYLVAGKDADTLNWQMAKPRAA